MNEKGFTFIETLVVVVIFSFILGLGFFMSQDLYRSTSFNSDTQAIAAAFERARTQSLDNIDQKPHGVVLTSGNYVIFEGAVYNPSDPNNYSISGNPNFTFTGPTQIVFTQLTGQSNASGSLVILDGSKSATISFNFEGRINW